MKKNSLYFQIRKLIIIFAPEYISMHYYQIIQSNQQHLLFNTKEDVKRSLSSPNIVSLFSRCGGIDTGFEHTGFNIMWANEYDKDIWKAYMLNHKETILDTRSITDIPADEVTECDGITGGSSCQSWSEGESKRGLSDKLGQLFGNYIRILDAKNPKFLLQKMLRDF